jgi:exodeoxyribonuclease V alpha subunit
VALASKVLVITGGPGVGKTTIVNAISAHSDGKGREASTLRPHWPGGQAHERSNWPRGQDHPPSARGRPKGGGFRRDIENPLDCELIVVDETSMVDVLLMNALLKAVPEKSAMLMVGDVDQLPSVGPGQVLADVIASGSIPVVRLSGGIVIAEKVGHFSNLG